MFGLFVAWLSMVLASILLVIIVQKYHVTPEFLRIFTHVERLILIKWTNEWGIVKVVKCKESDVIETRYEVRISVRTHPYEMIVGIEDGILRGKNVVDWVEWNQIEPPSRPEWGTRDEYLVPNYKCGPNVYIMGNQDGEAEIVAITNKDVNFVEKYKIICASLFICSCIILASMYYILHS